MTRRQIHLEPWQTDLPLIWESFTRLPESATHPERWQALLERVFGADGKRTQRFRTWGRSDGKHGVHWIAARAGKGMHTDPTYPRYTHQLVIRNDGWGVSGATKALPDEPMIPGTLYCCDTHSPHILMRDRRLGRGLYFLAISMDCDEVVPMPVPMHALLGYLADHMEAET